MARRRLASESICRLRSRLFAFVLPLAAMDDAELADISCRPAACAAFCDRSRRAGSRSAFSAGTGPGRSILLRPRRCTGTTTARGLRSAICLRAPSTPSDQYTRTAAILNQYNRNYNATPALEARFEALAKERIHDDPIRYYVALPVARLLNMLFRPRAEMLEVPLEWWQWREHPEMTMLRCGTRGAQPRLLYSWRNGVVALAAKRVGRPFRPCRGDGGFRCAAVRPAADPRQLGAALHAGVLPVADRVGELSFRERTAASKND